MSAKKTHTWVLRNTLSSVHNHPKQLSSTTRNRNTGKDVTLLPTGEIVFRKPLTNEKGEEVENTMPIFLFEQVWLEKKNREGKLETKPYMQQRYECPAPDATKADFDPDRWSELQRHKGAVDYFKQHIAVSYKDANGNELNKNFAATDKVYFELINLDELADKTADMEMLQAELIGEVGYVMKNDREEFERICYGMQVNPFGMGDGELFKILKNLIVRDADSFHKFLHGDEQSRWYKIVLNKALRFKRPGDESTVIYEDEHKNYYANGIVLASGFDALTAYYKSNPELFEALEVTVGLKKKEGVEATSEQSEQTARKRGRPSRSEAV